MLKFTVKSFNSCIFIGRSRFITSKSWILRHKKDEYVKLVQSKDGNRLRARSAFKLLEIQKKFNIIRPSDFVIDLGSSPGGWSVVVSDILKSNKNLTNTGLLCSIDLLEMNPVELIGSSFFIHGDFTSSFVKQEIWRSTSRKPNVILSDMLMNTCGQKQIDHIRSIELAKLVVEFAQENLVLGGNLAIKVLRGKNENEIMEDLKKNFKIVKYYKPNASRTESSEIYIVASDKINTI